MSSLTLASSRRPSLGDILPTGRRHVPRHPLAIDVVVRDVWQRCSHPNAPSSRRELGPVVRSLTDRTGAEAASAAVNSADARAVTDCRQKIERNTRSGLVVAAVAAAETKPNLIGDEVRKIGPSCDGDMTEAKRRRHGEERDPRGTASERGSGTSRLPPVGGRISGRDRDRGAPGQPKGRRAPRPRDPRHHSDGAIWRW
jgi:hypothetical protein